MKYNWSTFRLLYLRSYDLNLFFSMVKFKSFLIDRAHLLMLG